MTRLAVEIGGTFTDVVLEGAEGRLRTHKTPSTPDDPARAVFVALRDLDLESQPLEGFFHGSTVATNALLTRGGARAGLLVTRGFRDLLTLQRQLRDNVYDPFPTKPEPLIPSGLTREIAERVDHAGAVLEPMDEAGLLAAVDELRERGVDALAVCLLHSYRNPVHEQRAAELIAAAHPDLPVMLSSDVLPVFREYERASATAICAYVIVAVRHYLSRLEAHFAARGTPMLIMQSSGGLLPPEGIARRPLEMLESGPAAGVTAALAVARALDDPDVITLDMGGTSTDVCLITGGRAEQSSGRSLDGLPLGISSLDIVNIGAGGGSLGYVDAGGMLQVGPQSAGAHPGPACYGMGGTAPALTDALVALGWLRPEAFLGGAMTLDADAADRALAALDAGAADAMIRIAVAHIARAISQVSVQRGRDPRGHAIYAFGGMGPVLGALVAEELRIDRVVVPVHAGLFSALGLLLADLRRTYEQTELIALRGGRERLEQGFRRLERQAVGEFAGYGYPGDAIRFTRTVAMRYEGQGFELTVPFADDLEGAFHDAHRTAYGTAVPAKPIEVVTLRLEAAIPRVNAPDTSMPVTAAKPVRDSVEWQGARRECVFAPRGSVTELDGLAVIEADTTTAVVPPAWRATASPDGSLVLQR